MMQSNESCLWEHFQWSEQEQEQAQEGEIETLKIKKAPPSRRGLI